MNISERHHKRKSYNLEKNVEHLFQSWEKSNPSN